MRTEAVQSPPHFHRFLQSPALSVTLVSVIVNLCLSGLKIGVGLAVGSKALMADGLHSLSDLVSDGAVIAGLVLAGRGEDARHPFGWHKYATLARFVIGLLLLGASLAIILTALVDFRTSATAIPGFGAALVALLSLFCKEGIFYWTRLWARRLKSQLLMANAWHHRADSLTSFAVLIALVGVQIGGEQWAFLDSVVAFFLGAFLVVEAGKVLKSAFNDLMDAAPEQEILEDLREHILPSPGVTAYHHLRVRRIGDVFEMDMDIQVDPTISVEAGHAIAKRLKETIMKLHPEVVHVLIHVEPATAEHLKALGLSGEVKDEELT